jgi:RNA polymerase sigma-70 factor (ECF subfamily)
MNAGELGITRRGGYTNIRSESSEKGPAEAVPEYTPGSEADFERLYRTSYRRILGTLITMLRDREAAEDCTQEAFERAFKAWKSWKPDAPAEAWLHRIAINTAINGQRRERLQEVGALLRRVGRPAPSADPATVVESSDLVTALRKLPPKQAAAIVLRHYHGYTNREIAIALGVPERTVASRLAAARTRLQQLLAGRRATGKKNG